jgi:4-amino-4-deoxy-L-arabinose transferase-like glycosyltransferase
MEGRPRLSLVLPAFNEEAGIRQAVAEADDALAHLTEDYEILVVDDGSHDATAAVVEVLTITRPHVRLLRHEKNRGYGAALRTGFEAARFERIAFTDADCQFHLDDLARLLPLTEPHPVVAGFREKRQDSWRRCLLSRGYNLLVRTLLGTRVRDCDCALKVFRREALKHLLPAANGFFVNTEMLTRARQLGYDVAEVGVRHRPRLRGQSTVSLREVPRVLGELLPFWWSRVLFAGDAACGLAPSAKPQAAISALFLCVVAALLFFGQLRAPLLEPQEPRYAEIPRQMLAEGCFVTPVLHGQPYLDKPPLLYWLVMGSYQLCGVHDWSARLVPGMIGVLTVLATWWWGRRTLGERAGFWGALMLCLSARFVYLERMLTMDGVLCLCVTVAFATAHLAVTYPKRLRLWLMLSAVACGLGLLAKGPVALVLVAPPLLAYRWLDPRCPRFTWREAMMYLGVMLAVAGPWYVALSVQEPDFAWSFFWTHNVVRFFAPFDHQEPFWFHLPGLLLGMLPWTLLLPGLLRFLARRSARTAARRSPALGFCLLAFLWCTAFFSASGCKRATYILPALPPLALALGGYLDVVLLRTQWQPFWAMRERRRGSLAFPAALTALALGLGVVLTATFAKLLTPAMGITLASAALLATAAVLFAGRAVSWAMTATATFAVLLAGVHLLLPAYNQQFALRKELRIHAEIASTTRLSVVCYPQRYDSVSYYLPHADVRVYTVDQKQQMLRDLQHGDETLLLVKSGRLLQELLAEWPEGVEFIAHGKQGAVTVGWVRMREGPATNAVAQRD